MERIPLTLKELQQVELDIMQAFHDFCQQHGLRYYLGGGTAIGAVRHQGFIPWDDDIDIGMPREDYDKLCSLAKNLSTDRYVIEYPNNENKDFHYLFMKIYDTSTTLTENSRHNIKRGIYIDVFPLDGVGNSCDDARKSFSTINTLKRFHAAITCAVGENMQWYKKFVILAARILSPMIISERKVNFYTNNVCRRLTFDSSNYVGNVFGAWGFKEVMPKQYMGEPKEYKFEDTTVYGVEMPHEYLTSLYGDYMQLPPEEKRVSHHDYVYYNLDESYLD